jgi:fluoride exporter
MMTFSSVLAMCAICIGASVGALARWQLGLWLNTAHHSGAALPWGTLAANWIGGYVIGLAVVFFQHQTQLDPAWRLLVITGFLGALTTFSTFSAEIVTYLQQGRWTWAITSASLHLIGSLLLTGLGMKTMALLMASRAS